MPVNIGFAYVVPGRLELPTSTLSVWRSNQLSYRTVSDATVKSNLRLKLFQGFCPVSFFSILKTGVREYKKIFGKTYFRIL